MSNRDRIILLKGKLRSDVRSCRWNDRRKVYDVVFEDGACFHYKPENVEVLKPARRINPPVRVSRVGDGKIFNVVGIEEFIGGDKPNCRKAYRVYFNDGSIKDYCSGYLRIEECVSDKKSVNVFNYLKDISAFSRIETEDRTISLRDKYESVDFISSDSVLADYLNPERSLSAKKKPGRPSQSQPIPIFPFGCNKSQYAAVCNALNNRISVIQGPPGTGKTQTILNIVANLLLAGKSIEVVSNNNSAVLNVVEKLSKPEYGLDWLVARLGRSENKREFINGQTGLYPDISEWRKSDSKVCIAEADRLSTTCLKLFEKEERLARLKQELDEIEIQLKEIPQADFDVIPQKVKRRLTTYSRALALSVSFEKQFDRRGKLGLLNKMRCRFYGLGPNYDDAQRYLDLIQIILHHDEVSEEVSRLTEEMKHLPEAKKEWADVSLRILKNKLFEKYGNRQSRRVFSGSELNHSAVDFLNEYPIVLSTTFSATSNISSNVLFDYLIVDEASQVDIAAGALALNCARCAVIVGDDKQLPNVVSDEEKAQTDFTFEKYHICEHYRFVGNSFLSSVCKVVPTAPQTMLKEHYRCHPYIIGFCNRQFYDNQLVPMTPGTQRDKALGVYRSVRGNQARGTFNLRQAEIICREILPSLPFPQSEIGIIAPYNKQVDLIRKMLDESGFVDVQVATVHRFQGREKDAIVLSTVDNAISDFVDDPHLVNVAVSRAKKKFVLVTSGNDMTDGNLKDLLDYIAYYDGDIQTSRLTSVFDMLYEQYSKERLMFLSTHHRVSNELSENIVYGLLCDILTERKQNTLGVLCHYPLRRLARNLSMLTEEEYIFSQRSWSHVDFLIYNKLTHQPKFAIEVDGFYYHREGTEQSRRDALKNQVLAKSGLPLLRLSTIGSNEREKILRML